jgi:hypothetical protein
VRKKHIKRSHFNKIYTSEELLNHVNSELDNDTFRRHCAEVADNLNIDVVIVEDLLRDNSFQVLSLIQSSVLKEKEVRINIFGFIYFQTVHIKYIYKRMIKSRLLRN